MSSLVWPVGRRIAWMLQDGFATAAQDMKRPRRGEKPASRPQTACCWPPQSALDADGDVLHSAGARASTSTR